MTKLPRLLVPEAVQTSSMDCGPAALKSLLEGFGIPVNYGRLREACQTGVDGTSIDTMEDVANQLGLHAEQIMLPADRVLMDEARALPAIAVTVLPNGVTHFVVVWRRFGRFVELMDPAVGRRWVSAARFLSDLYIHRQPVPAEGWREYAGSGDFLAPLRRRLRLLGIENGGALSAALDDPSWRSLAALDAGVRMLEPLVVSGAIGRGIESARVLDEFLRDDGAIPEHYWPVRADASGNDLVLRGAVLVRALGVAPATASSPELLAVLQQHTARPGRELLRLLRADGVFTPALLVGALALAGAAVIFEAILWRGLIEFGRSLFAAALAFSAALLGLEIPIASTLLRFGRRLEIRLRLAFLEKLPRLGDRYFQSRLMSDMAERGHSIHLVRRLPELGGQLLRYSFEIVFTTAGIAWIDPASAPIALLAAFIALAIPLASQPLLTERDLRLRTHAGALTHFYLDALLGLIAIQTHGGQPAMGRAHESLLTHWARAGLNLQRAAVSRRLRTGHLAAGLAPGARRRSGRSVATGVLGAESPGAGAGNRTHFLAISLISEYYVAIIGTVRRIGTENHRQNHRRPARRRHFHPSGKRECRRRGTSGAARYQLVRCRRDARRDCGRLRGGKVEPGRTASRLASAGVRPRPGGRHRVGRFAPRPTASAHRVGGSGRATVESAAAGKPALRQRLCQRRRRH